MPFTVKFIDARQPLSVQLHGNTSPIIPGAYEAWVILRAEPDAHVILGADFKNGNELKRAVENNTFVDRLHRVPVFAGDVIHVPAGTLHSVGAGIFLYEIRNPVMITYRAHDWGRDRQMHIEKCAELYDSAAPYGKIIPPRLDKNREKIFESDRFILERLDAASGIWQDNSDRFLVYTAVAPGYVELGGKKYPYRAGETFMTVANAGEFTLNGGLLFKTFMK